MAILTPKSSLGKYLSLEPRTTSLFKADFSQSISPLSLATLQKSPEVAVLMGLSAHPTHLPWNTFLVAYQISSAFTKSRLPTFRCSVNQQSSCIIFDLELLSFTHRQPLSRHRSLKAGALSMGYSIWQQLFPSLFDRKLWFTH